ncbi:hypothetical protein [Plantactinospora soyae]|uniref:Ricin B lectin domain-containing protein n=1 Tax=Plantactinospora soyae TaxID=1544732 RepID=A0A927MEB6_9ACTN|nr:hypothetical protein [Plantactinospora soyae]MBE1489535.1 hypothetical protein [Plantactinospora soyae]
MIVLRLRQIALSVLVIGVIASPSAVHAAPAATRTAENQVTAAATITWTLARAQNPTADQQDAYARITSAMNAAVARYNALSDLGKSITVHYVPGVPTADGNINGSIRFGSNRSYMNERTALHETAHTLGVGLSGGWRTLGGSGSWTGAQATALVRQYDGANAVLRTGGGHFWPYGLNYDNEFSQTNADRHVWIVVAMKRDGL